ncbi:MBL fold metallo-hydrolase [Tahibacter amnicola]|uniref:MBL fold metallo-hydrolase n=1 Tax=Tahibacter amnicola TaxID=2976241 RepID=A0ABY6B804_9GAMM|nr:MBL fold metallo-hydrolase [Tahibacter amnicola]UXI66218.1 MBL fold metallo-hydrolase [Tahibacter amnicola]
MSERALYLREDVYFEPLFNQWYAWPYLIPPVTAARYVENTHLRIMKSFVNNYQLHIIAAQEPTLTGGEFLSCTEQQVDDIKRLVDRVETDQHDLLALSNAVRELDDLLLKHTSGESLTPLYEKVPAPLRGYVELVFDREHRATFRLIEPLLYRSGFYKPELQGLSFGSLTRVGSRPFVLSTPRLPDENHLQVSADFNAGIVDRVFKARQHPIPEGEIDALFAGHACSGGLHYRDLFTTDKPVRQPRPVESGVRLQYTGHAGFLVQSPEVSILIDPVIATRDPADPNAIIGFSDLPETIDYVCLTHNHQDHVNFETLLQLRHKIKRVLVPKSNGGKLTDPSLRLLLRQFGFDVVEMDECDEVAVGGGSITAIPFLGEHGDLDIRSKSAWLVRLEGRKMFFGADSANPDIALYANLKEYLTDLDVYAIGMECVGAPYTWLYGALATRKVGKAVKESRRLNGSDAKQAFDVIDMVRPKRVFVYALGMEPWYKYFMGIDYNENSTQMREVALFKEQCREIGLEAEPLFGSREYEMAPGVA